MFSNVRPVRAGLHSVDTAATDALTRIPTAHFHSMDWARKTVAICLAVIDAAVVGNRAYAREWLHSIARAPDAASTMSVFSAACEAVVAHAFRSKQDVAVMTQFVLDLERDVRAEFSAHRASKDIDAMNDSDIAELAAGLVRVVGMHDRDTAIHLDATAALARRIALAMDLPDVQVVTIELAARLHDIGKVGVRKDVLSKPGALTADEWHEMRLHAELGAAALLDISKLAHLAPIVRAHHERMDGDGYPDRLASHEIPPEARVIAVADAFHAMTTERSYRRAMLPNDALETLAENAGPQFDADVVAAIFELFRYTRRSHRSIA